MQEADRTLELSSGEMRRVVDLAMRWIVRHIETLPEQPAVNVEGAAEVAREVMEPLPEKGRPLESVLEALFGRFVPRSFTTPGPGYLAYVPGGGIFHAAVADLISNAVNRYVGVWAAAPALAQIEAVVIRWLCDLVGYPAGALGVLTSGGSLAGGWAIVAARRNRLPDRFLDGTIYMSDQTHHSLVKAAVLAGFPEEQVRMIPTDRRFRIRLDVLRCRIREDRAKGRVPFLVVGNAGTTNTGAVDDLSGLAEIAERESLWLHVDAAYGGFFMLTERGRRRMAGIERADSIVLDPHKALFLPYGTGALLVRDGAALRRAFSLHAEYLPPMQEDPEFVDFCQISPELSRPFRGLRLWLPIQMHGIEPFRRNLEEKLDLAEWITRELKKIEGIEIEAEPQLSTLAFRQVRPGESEEALNERNRRLLERINSRKRVYLTGTMVKGRFVIRICVVSFRTHLDRMQACLEDIRAACGTT